MDTRERASAEDRGVEGFADRVGIFAGHWSEYKNGPTGTRKTQTHTKTDINRKQTLIGTYSKDGLVKKKS